MLLLPAAWALFGQVAAEVQTRLDPLLPLAAVAEPHADHLLLQVQTLGHAQDLLGRGLALLDEASLQGLFRSHTGKERMVEEDVCVCVCVCVCVGVGGGGGGRVG